MSKNCTKCGEEKPIFEFSKDKQKKDGLRSSCKNCNKNLKNKYAKEHKKEKSLYDKKRRKRLKKEIAQRKKEYYQKNKNKIQEKAKIKHLQFPWIRIFWGIKQRCNNKNSQAYKNYGGRGIKCLITEEEIKELWFRDKAYEMKQPSIDRIDNDDNYIFSNCEFIEKDENSIKNKRKPILQYDLQGNFIREYQSVKEASLKTLNKYKYISAIANGIKQIKFIWRYKDE